MIDALCGDSPAFRDGVAALDKWYCTEIKTTTPVWLQRPAAQVRLRNPTAQATTVQTLVAQLQPTAWPRATLKQGRQDPLVGDFAFVRQ